MTRNNISRIFFLLLFLFILSFFFKSELFRFRSDAALTSSQKNLLWIEAAQSLSSGDVPVGAILLYDDSILSLGHNTVNSDTTISGHAEINAINNAIRKIGFASFSKLNREKLILVSTFEPCLMCQGAINEFHILHTYFVKDKGIFHWLKNDAQQFRYEWNKRQSAGEEIQDSLFMLHPGYREKNSR